MRIKLKERDMYKANIKIDCLLWQRKELIDMHRDACDERDSALGDARQLRKELRRMQGPQMKTRTIVKSEFEQMLKHYFGYKEVVIKKISIGANHTEQTILPASSMEIDFSYSRKESEEEAK